MLYDTHRSVTAKKSLLERQGILQGKLRERICQCNGGLQKGSLTFYDKDAILLTVQVECMTLCKISMEIGQYALPTLQCSCKPSMTSYALLRRTLFSFDDSEDDNIVSLS